jgi:cytochrome c biogenesis protein CcmG, thiol:disulfide interchange protein DsbE
MPFEWDAPASVNRRGFLKGCAATLVTWQEAVQAPLAYGNELRVGAQAPEATLVTLDGQRISTKDLLGNVVILMFWATWCAPCRTELPLVSSYLSRHAERGLRVLGFSLDTVETLGEVRQIAQSLPFGVGLWSNSSAPGYGRIWRLPVSFTIDRTGRLVTDGWKEKQPVWTASRLEEVVTPLL